MLPSSRFSRGIWLHDVNCCRGLFPPRFKGLTCVYLYILHYTNDNTALDYEFCEGAAFELLFMITTSDFQVEIMYNA